MFGNTLTMLTIRTSELITLSKSGKSLTGKMLKRDFCQLPQRNDDLIEYFHLSLKFLFSYFFMNFKLIYLKRILYVEKESDMLSQNIGN